MRRVGRPDIKRPVKQQGAKLIPYYRAKLLENFASRQRTNPAYSLRAYARFLNIQPASIGAVLKGKRHLAQNEGQRIATKLSLSPSERSKFLRSLRQQKKSLNACIDDSAPLELDGELLQEETHYRVIAEWEHYAILSLMDMSDFVSSSDHIANRLGITKTRAEVCILNLIQSGLVNQSSNGQMKKNVDHIRTTEDISSAALKQSHRETLEIGLKKLETVPMELRDFSSSTLLISREKLPEAKAFIRRFRKQFVTETEDLDGNEVFQIALQFYPLTKLSEEK